MACPAGELSIAFHSQFAPYFFRGVAGNWKGLYRDYWQSVAKLANCDSVIFKRFELLGTGVYEEFQLNNDIRDGLVFSSTQPSYLFPTAPSFFSYTSAATWYRLMLLERNPLGNKAEVASASFFIVFPLDILILFFLSCKIINFFDSCFKKFRLQRFEEIPSNVKSILNLSDLLRYALFSFSIVFLVHQWHGYFNGNNLLSITIEGTSFFTMTDQFRQRERQLVVDSFEPLFADHESLQIFGGNSSFIYGTSVRDRFRITCEQLSRVGVFQEFEYMEYLSNLHLYDQCKLTQIKLDKGQSTGLGWMDEAVQNGRPYSYLMAKNGTRRIREKMEFALASVYSEDNVANFLLPRNMPIKVSLAIERRGTVNEPQFKKAAVSLTHLQFPLLFLILGQTISLAGFIMEWAYYSCEKRFLCCRILMNCG